MDGPDPGRKRFTELVALLEAGRASDADREELELYVAEDPALRQELAVRPPPRAADRDWLARITADERVQRLEKSRGVLAERVVGGALLGAGVLLAPAVPVLGGAAVIAGVGVLVWSTIALRVRELRDDPYREIER